MKTLVFLTLLAIVSIPAFGQTLPLTPTENSARGIQFAELPPLPNATAPLPKKSQSDARPAPVSFIAIGPTLGATTDSGFPSGSQTRAGGFIEGQYSFRALSLEFGMGGSMSITNQPRFFDQGNGAVFEAEPIGRMYLPVAKDWSLYFDGGANMQRFSDLAVLNPVAGFGVRKLSADSDGALNHSISVGFKCLFDDMNGSVGNDKIWRGYRGEFQLFKKLGPTLGFLVGGKVDRQANAVLFAPRTQASVNVGIAFGGR